MKRALMTAAVVGVFLVGPVLVLVGAVGVVLMRDALGGGR